MAKRYRLPPGQTVAAVVAPARIAEEAGAYTAWRERPDGSVEVATVSADGIRRWVVDENGTTVWLGQDSPPSPGRWIYAVVLAGPAGIVVCALVLAGLATRFLPERFAWLFLIGLAMAASFVGLLLRFSPERLLQHMGGEWHEPTMLEGWRPRTSAQLASVERLADKNGGVAKVREAAGEGVDVVVHRWGRRQLYFVDASGVERRVEFDSTYKGAPWLEVRTRDQDVD